MSELENAVQRWLEAKRQQILREDSNGELELEVRKQERDVEDAIYNEKINPKKIISIAQERDPITHLVTLTVYYIA
jgi:hypothetical protein